MTNHQATTQGQSRIPNVTFESHGISSSTRLLLAAGIVAGPIFVVTGAVQAVTRDGFDLSHQPLSLLSLGELGWIQIANFVLAGLLSLAFAIGVGRCLTSGPGSTWAARLIALFGTGMVMGGVFVADPALGFPVGTPDSIPDSLSWHGLLHAIAPPLAFLSFVGACLVMARRCARQGRRGAAALTRVVAAGCLLLAIPVGPGASPRLFASVALAFAWIAGLAISLIRAGWRPAEQDTDRAIDDNVEKRTCCWNSPG